MTLRGRLLLALAYILLLAIVALEVPLAISLRDRVDAAIAAAASACASACVLTSALTRSRTERINGTSSAPIASTST